MGLNWDSFNNTMGDIGSAFSAAGANAATGRQTQDQANISRYLALMQGINTDLAQRRYNSSEYQRNAGNAARGSYMEGVQDFNVTPPPGVNMGTVTGGARPSAIVDKEGLGGLLRRQAVAQMVTPQGNNLGGLPSLPVLPAQPKASGLSKFLSIFGPIAKVAGAIF